MILMSEDGHLMLATFAAADGPVYPRVVFDPFRGEEPRQFKYMWDSPHVKEWELRTRELWQVLAELEKSGLVRVVASVDDENPDRFEITGAGRRIAEYWDAEQPRDV